MNQNNLLATLQENRFMQTEEQVTNFENALAEIAENPNENKLSAYHLILDDQCQQPEVMFSLIHFLESFDIEKQITAFIHVVPQLMITAPEWTRIIHNRILNDVSACQVYQNLLHSANLNTPHFFYHLLEEGKNSGEAKRSPTSMSNLSFMDTINKRSRGSGHEQVL